MIEKKLFHEIPKSADFHSAIMTTYSFDFYHFESQVLKTLKSKGITNISVFADTTMLDQSIGFATGHLKSLSTSYTVSGIPCRGAFHPKLTILAGEDDVLLIQGSGNITSGGHGKNHELFSVFYANKVDKKQLPLIQEAWSYINGLAKHTDGISKEKLNWVTSNCNLLKETPKKKHQFHSISEAYKAALLYNEETSIWQQLMNLVPLNKVNKIKIYSPFYDEKGTLLARLLQRSDSASINAFIQPNKGIHPFKMEEHESIQFHSWEETVRAKSVIKKIANRKLHSKIFYFEVGDEVYLLFGSPNATIAAFGGDDYRGVNDEFAVLIQLKDNSILDELGLNGSSAIIKPQDNKQIIDAENEIEEEQKSNNKKIKLLGVDNNSGELIVFISNNTSYTTSSLCIYNQWGEIIEQHVVDVTDNKIKITLNEYTNNILGYVQLLNDDGVINSNKQIINNLQNLWNTNPSVENRKLMKLSSLLETGNNKVFDVINFFNDIHSNKRLSKKGSGGQPNGSKNDNEEATSANLTYEEAIVLDKEKKENKELLAQHNAIKVWDAIEKYFNDLTLQEAEEDMNDEEEGEATTSRERKDKISNKSYIQLNSKHVLKNKRKQIQKFFHNYVKALKTTNSLKSYEIDIVDLAMFLIVANQLKNYAESKVILKINDDTKESNIVLLPTLGNLSELGSFSGVLLNTLGAFINIVVKFKLKEYSDEYNQKKATHYMQLVKYNALFLVSIIKQNYKGHSNGELWSDVLAYNIFDKFGVLDSDYENKLISFHDNKINNSTITESKEVINNWQTNFVNDNLSSVFYSCKGLGVCIVNSFLPKTGHKTFLKISRPGFDFNESVNDFVLDELYKIETGELMKSKQNFQKNQLKSISIR